MHCEYLLVVNIHILLFLRMCFLGVTVIATKVPLLQVAQRSVLRHSDSELHLCIRESYH